MDSDLALLALNLVGPGIVLLFAVPFVWIWSATPGHNYLLLFALACGLTVAGALVQILPPASEAGLSVLLSNPLLFGAAVAVAEGLLRRYGHRLGLIWDLAIVAVVTAAIWYFWFVDRNFLARAYILNFSIGGLLLFIAFRLRHLARGGTVDRAVFWVLLVYGAFMFPRTVLTVSGVAPTTERAFSAPFFWQAAHLSNAVLATALGLAVLMSILTEHLDNLRRERDVDRLTGIYNRRGFEDRAEALMALPAGTPMTLVLCDLDHFKLVNDTFGHRAGDDVLRAFGALLQASCRKSDVVGRIGGEEFAILLPDLERGEAQAFVGRLQEAIEQARFPLPDAAHAVRASLGIGDRKPDEDYLAWFDRVDAALYRAKAEGRGRAVFV